MRIFIALDIDEAIRERIQRFMEGVQGFAPDARWVRPESMHVTVKFIGEKPQESVEAIKRELGTIQAAAIEISFRGYGFFPSAKAARVFWVGIEADTALPELANAVDTTLGTRGIPKEERPFNPHLTLARAGGGGSGAPRWRRGNGPNKIFQRLQEKLAAMSAPDFGTMTAREFFLFQSQLMRGGSRYTKIGSFALTEKTGASQRSLDPCQDGNSR